MGKKFLRNAGIAAATLFAVSGPVAGQGPQLAMLDQLDSGRWVLRMREPGAPTEALCMASGRRLIQLRHPDASCDRVVVQDSASEVTVQYTCRGRGYGRTHIRKETNRLVQIDSQGIANGLPFEFNAEARRVGDCGT